MNRHVIFDLDGTLFDSMDFWDGVGKKFLMSEGICELPPDFNDRVKAMSVAQSCQYFREELGAHRSDEYIAEWMRELVADKYRYEAEFKPNVRETLDILKDNGITMCIATATYGSLVREALERLGASHYFEFVLSCYEVGSGKDDVKIFDMARERLGGTKADTVVVEDAIHAITTAKSNGYKVIAVEDRHQAHNLERIKALADAYTPVMDADVIMNI